MVVELEPLGGVVALTVPPGVRSRNAAPVPVCVELLLVLDADVWVPVELLPSICKTGKKER